MEGQNVNIQLNIHSPLLEVNFCYKCGKAVKPAVIQDYFRHMGYVERLYHTVIRPVVVYGSECWVLTENIKQKLLVFERRLLRRIFGPTQKTNGEWRQKTNEELENLINYENIVRHIKSKRLSWVGHVERMPDERVVKSIYKWKPHATRPKGRPRLRWDDDMRDDLRKMGVNNWKRKAQERKPWRGIIEQAKTHKKL